MSVAAYNKFSLLNQDDEGTKGSSGVAPAKSKTTTASPANPEEPKKAQQQSKGGPASRSGRYYPRGGGPKPQATDANANAGEESSLPTQRFDRTEGRHERGRGRGGPGRGEGRGRGRGRGFKDDRHSKTGIVDTSKQVSQGWGGTDGNNELAVEAAAEKDAQDETKAEGEGGASWGDDAPAASWGGGEGTPAEGEAAAAAEGDKSAPPAQEEDNTMTLDEYLAKRADAGLSGLIGSTQLRKANEGAGEDLFAGARQLLLDDEDEEEFYAGKPKTQRAPKAKEVKERITIEIDGQFSDANSRGGRGRGRGGRGDFRGRGRGGGERGGRGGYRGGRNAGARPLNVDDEKAFPSLG